MFRTVDFLCNVVFKSTIYPSEILWRVEREVCCTAFVYALLFYMQVIVKSNQTSSQFDLHHSVSKPDVDRPHGLGLSVMLGFC